SFDVELVAAAVPFSGPLSLWERVRHCLTDRARLSPCNGYELTDEHWALIEPLLPPQRRTTRGGVWRDHRTVVNGIFWVLFSGAAWRDMPERYGSCKTAHDRFRRWQRNGTWDHVLATLRLDRKSTRLNSSH